MKKSQGEIFGIALMFVVIIVGFILFAKIKSLNPDNTGNSVTEGKYKILAEGTLNTVLELSTGCKVERNKDSLRDLVIYCIDNSYSSNNDPEIDCIDENGADITVLSCTKVIKILNESLKGFFENPNSIGPLPYLLKVSPSYGSVETLDTNITNFGRFEYGGEIINESNYLDYGYQRAPSGPRDLATSKRSVNFELYLYYR